MNSLQRDDSLRSLCLSFVFAWGPLVTGCGGAEAPHALPLHSDGRALRTREGRTQILRGVNARVRGLFDVTFSDGRLPLEPIPEFGAEDARRARQLGFNLLRLPLNWSGLEPQPGHFDDAYLRRVQENVDHCRAAGVYVLLDMHQDAWSKEIGEDGAPLWAIQPPPEKLLGGPLLDLEARRLSGQVLRAFKGFFEEDREGVQGRFIAAAASLMRRFAGDEAVVGIEIFNEPLGTPAALQAFHERAARALREVTDKLIFFEPSALRNQADEAPLPDAPFPVAGAVYAPHVYTLAFGDPRGELGGLTYERLAPSVRAARDEARAHGAPLFIGEWGIGPTAQNAARWLRYELDAQDEVLASSALWLWKEQSQGSWGLFDLDEGTGRWIERQGYIQAVSRPYVQVAGGDLRAVRYDSEAQRLRYEVERGAVPVGDEVFVPAWFPRPVAVCDGSAVAAERDPATAVLRISCGERGSHVVEVVQGQ